MTRVVAFHRPHRPATESVTGVQAGAPALRAVPASAPQTPAGPASRAWLAVIAAALGVYGLAYMVWVALHGPGSGAAFSDVAVLPISAAAAVLAWWAAHDPRAAWRRRDAWRWIAFGCVSWFIADVTWWYLEAVRHVSPSPSPADGFYLLFYGLVLVGLLRLPARRERGAERVALGLDLATVAVVTFMFVWYLVALPTLHGGGRVDLAAVIELAYPLADTMLVLAITRVLLRRRSGADNRAVLWFLVAATAALAAADVLYARLDLAGQYESGSLPDGLWLAALLLVALAALAQLGFAPQAAPFVGRERSYTSVSKLPYLAMVAGLGLVLFETTRDASGPLAMLVLSALALTAIVVARQLTVLHENDRLAGELRRLADTDPLTDLANRRHFFQVAAARLERGPALPAAVLMIDVDRFKHINDEFGHPTGDLVIREVARRCAAVVRPTDLLARYGGDELVALLVGAGPDEVQAIAERLREHMSRTAVFTPAGPVPVTVSIGVGATDRAGSLDDLLRAADLALYRAKDGGRDRACGRRVTGVPRDAAVAAAHRHVT